MGKPLNLNAICPYYTMFPLQFPLKVLEKAKHGEEVLDPFCGRGTTLFAARISGLRSTGVDSNPVAAAIAKAKLVNVQPAAVIDRCREVLESDSNFEIPVGEFWQLCYHPKTLEDISKLRAHFLSNRRCHIDIALRALILGLLHGPQRKTMDSYLSNQMPRTFASKPRSAVRYWNYHGLKPRQVDVLSLVHRKAVELFLDSLQPGRGAVLHNDIRRLTKDEWNQKFSWIITSPPYFGMRTYWPDQWLRNWFLGGPSIVDYSQRYLLKVENRHEFQKELSETWKKLAKWSRSGGRLVIRFGALPSKKVDHRTLLKDSISESDSGWRILTIKNAGLASGGRRQAPQFNAKSSSGIEEIDLYARLER